MAREITNQRHARAVRDFSFCYLCAEPIGDMDDRNHDHVPPKKLFAEEDRDFPLKLNVHASPCHSSLNLEDEVTGQLFGLLHGASPSPQNDRLNLTAMKTEGGGSVVGFSAQNLGFLIRRWLRGFHAALYHQPLHLDTRFKIEPPMPSAEPVSGGWKEIPIPEIHATIVKEIKKHRALRKLDKISAYNGRLRYECFWDQLSDGSWTCCFALNLYDWKDLGDDQNFEQRGCVGIYTLPCGKKPAGCSTASPLEASFTNFNPRDPFST